jgi:small subunit ribosomal protein S8
MTTDTLADMLTRIRNANLAKHQIVQIPSTKLTRNVAQVLFAEGLIDSFEELKNGLTSSLLVSLKYEGKERKPSIEKIQRISKPGLRVYSGAKKNAPNSRRVWNCNCFDFSWINDRSPGAQSGCWW